MGEILKFVKPDGIGVSGDWTPDFVVKARRTEQGFEVAIDELDVGDTPNAGSIFRRVAAELIPIANGLVNHAEQLTPSPRGGIIAQVTLYEDGTSDMHLIPFENIPQRAWATAAFKRILEYVRGAPLKT